MIQMDLYLDGSFYMPCCFCWSMHGENHLSYFCLSHSIAERAIALLFAFLSMPDFDQLAKNARRNAILTKPTAQSH